MSKGNLPVDDVVEERSPVDARMSGLAAFNQNRKQSSRENLLVAATTLFCRDGYAAVSVEDIATEAGVSRVTFYRHFPTKAAVAMELFQRAAVQGTPRFTVIAARDFRDRDTVIAWLADFFVGDRELRGLLRVLAQASVAEADFSKSAQPFIFDIIAILGTTIPSFDIRPELPGAAYRRTKAWLLVYTILDQSNRAAINTDGGIDPMMIEVLADSFLEFVCGDFEPA